jgi:malate dehydrogenase (oxaloacetate-decarboxylating)
MANPSPGNSITLRVEAPSSFSATSELAAAVGAAGAAITALDVSESHHETLVVDVTCNTTDDEHAARVKDALNALDGVTVQHVSDRTFLMHLGGKLEVVPKVALRNRDDLSRAYTPGVARVCLAIAEDPAAARNLTVKRNTIAVVTDGSAVLGLGNIGPAAALPVMEGKAALFKQFANVDAWPVCLDTQDTEEIIKIVKALAPVYGGVNLEDIAAPRCFEIENRLRAELDIPVFHDDQHGTAIVTLAALVNALRVVGKKLDEVKIVVSGVGAAGSAIIQLLKAQGAQHIVAAGRSGAIHSARPTGTSTAAGSRRTRTRKASPARCTRHSSARMCSSASAPRTSSARNRWQPWLRTPSCSPWPTRRRKSIRSSHPGTPPL